MHRFLPQFLIALALSLSMMSCGPSDAELELMRIKEQENREVFQKMIADSLVKVESTFAEFKEDVARMKGDLAVARDRLERSKEVQFLRTPSEREAQIREATAEVERIATWLEENEPNLAHWKELRDDLRRQARR